MKKILCLILAVVCALLAVSCNHIPPEETTAIPQNQPDPSKVVIPIVYDSKQPTYGTTNDDPSNTDVINIITIAPPIFSCYFQQKTISKSQATAIINLLEGLEETGEPAPMISTEEFDLQATHYTTEIDYHSMWIEANNKIYRIVKNYDYQNDRYTIKSICRVETHFGSGIYLKSNLEFEEQFFDAFRYWPYDYWYGEYNPSKSDTLTIEHCYTADSKLQIVVKNIVIDKGKNRYEHSGRITVEITSKTDQELTLGLRCQQSDDNMGIGDAETLTLQANIPQTVELSFRMGSNSYYITIWEGLTYIRINLSNMDTLYSK